MRPGNDQVALDGRLVTLDDKTSDLRGADLPALAAWLDAERPGVRTGKLQGEMIAGGKSNLTYRITDGVNTWALRRPPLAHVLPTAHDMVREYTVINAFNSTRVPVPEAVALCEDTAVLGAQFYLMGWVDGVVLDKPALLRDLDPSDAARCCELVVDTLVDLHDVDPVVAGLGGFGRPEGFLARQLRRWHQQWQASETRPLVEFSRTVEALTLTMPEQSASGIVHGDYRLTNVMLAPSLERIAAVVDWEMATIGDPLADVGLLYVYQSLAQQGDLIMPHMPSAAGFLTAEQMVTRYAAGSPRDLTHLDWYIAFGYFKLAVIAEGIHYRYVAGKTIGAGFEHFGAAVPVLLRAALRTLAHR